MGKQKRGQKGSIWLVVGGAVLVVAVLIAGSLWSSRGGQSTAVVQSDAELGASPGLHGPASAKVTVVEYSDYL